MEKILEFLASHYKLIVLCIVVIFEVVLICLNRRKPVKVVDAITTTIQDVLPSLILVAEQSFRGQQQGANKLMMVLELVHNYLRSKYGFSTEQVLEYDDYIKNKIEAILSTPQKKGNNDEN